MAKNGMVRYVFENRPNEMRQIVVKYGLSPAQNEQDLWKKINYIVKTFPQDAIRDIVSIHPDKNIILKVNSLGQSPESSTGHITAESPISKQDIEKLQVDTNVVDKASDKKSNACGCGGSSGCDGGGCKCGGSCGSKKSNADGDSVRNPNTPPPNPTQVEDKSYLKEHLPLVVIGSLAVIGGLLLLNKQLNKG